MLQQQQQQQQQQSGDTYGNSNVLETRLKRDSQNKREAEAKSKRGKRDRTIGTTTDADNDFGY